MDTSKATLFTTSFSTLTRKSLAVFGLLLAVSGATLFFSPQTVHASVLFEQDDDSALSTAHSGTYGQQTYIHTSTQYAWNIKRILIKVAIINPYAWGHPDMTDADCKALDLSFPSHAGYWNGTQQNIENPYGTAWQGIDVHSDPTNHICSYTSNTGSAFLSLGSGQDYDMVYDSGGLGGYIGAYGSPTDVSAGSYGYFNYGYNATPTAEGTVSDVAIMFCDDITCNFPPPTGGGGGSPPCDIGSSCIASTTPADLQNTATSTAYNFGVAGTIDASDIGSNMSVKIQYYNDTLAQVVVSPSVVSHYITFPLTATTTTDFSFSTTTNMASAPLGRYYMKTTINKDEFSFFGLFSFWNEAIVTKVTTFYVSTTTAHIYVTGYDAIADTSNPANITAIEAGIQTCDFSWGDLASTTKISKFVTCLVVPNSSSLSITFNQFQQNVLTLAPWGYVTRFVNILASTTPVKPPPLTYKFGSSSPAVLQAYTASDPITFQVFDYMGSSSPLLQIRADDGSNKNVWDIIDPFITFLVTIGVLLVVLGDIMGFSMPSGESENERMRKIDYSKMSDKQFEKKVKIEYLTEDEQRMQRRNRL